MMNATYMEDDYALEMLEHHTSLFLRTVGVDRWTDKSTVGATERSGAAPLDGLVGVEVLVFP